MSRQTLSHITIMYNQDFDGPPSNSESHNEPEDPFSSGLTSLTNDTLRGDTARESVVSVAKNISTVLSDLCGIPTTLHAVTKIDDVKSYIKEYGDTSSLIFNLCESLNQDARFEARVASVIHSAKIPYTGNQPRTLSLCLNKFRTTEKLKKHGIRVPDSHLITKVKDIPTALSFPLIVKPNREDGSTGIDSTSVVNTQAELTDQVKRILRECKQSALIQQYIDGREISVALLGHKQMKILGIGEVDFSNLHPELPKIVTYASKWVPGTPEYEGTVSVPAKLSDTQKTHIEWTARAVAKAVSLSGYGRIDIRLTPEGTPYVVDVNPNCDLDPEAGLAKTANRNGISYRQLVVEILEAALQAQAGKKTHHLRDFLSFFPGLQDTNPITTTGESTITL